MKSRICLISMLVFYLSSSPSGFWLEPALAGGAVDRGTISSPRASTRQFSFSSSNPRTMGPKSQSWVYQSRSPVGHSLPGKSHFKHRSLNHPHRIRRAPFIYAPAVSEPSEPIVIIVSEEKNPVNASVEQQTKPSPPPRPLIIEERCGKYVRVPWPESGVLHEIDLKGSCRQ